VYPEMLLAVTVYEPGARGLKFQYGLAVVYPPPLTVIPCPDKEKSVPDEFT